MHPLRIFDQKMRTDTDPLSTTNRSELISIARRGDSSQQCEI